MINFDKFLASFITEMKKYQPITCYNLPACIKKALEDQGLEYKDGEIVKTQDIITVESEDEKIRKRIIQAIKIREKEMNEEWSDEIAWLEKQEEQKPTDKIQLGKKYKCIASPRYSTFMVGQIYKPEDKFLCSLMNFCYDCFELIEDGEKKSVDKIEPKFKIGDWIVYREGIWKIGNIALENYYELLKTNNEVATRSIKEVDENAHLWTIQDAKDGDVLAYETDEEDLWIMIYWSLYEPYEGHVHYHALLVNDNFSDKGTCCICIDNLKPATKEQRDQLEKAMADAGYIWDSKSKRLLSLKAGLNYTQNPAWSEEDETGWTNTMIMIKEVASNHYTKDSIKLVIDWLKSLKQRIGWKPSEE